MPDPNFCSLFSGPQGASAGAAPSRPPPEPLTLKANKYSRVADPGLSSLGLGLRARIPKGACCARVRRRRKFCTGHSGDGTGSEENGEEGGRWGRVRAPLRGKGELAGPGWEDGSWAPPSISFGRFDSGRVGRGGRGPRSWQRLKPPRPRWERGSLEKLAAGLGRGGGGRGPAFPELRAGRPARSPLLQAQSGGGHHTHAARLTARPGPVCLSG